MKISSINEVSSSQFSISDVFAARRCPSYSSSIIKKRSHNGFMFMEKGECLYSWSGEKVRLSPSSLLYLPFNSKHKMEVLSEKLEFVIVNFTIKDENNETLIFSEKPFLISNNIGKICENLIKNLVDNFSTGANNFKNISYLSSLLSEICTQKIIPNIKVSPAINHINENYLEPIDGEKLADLCMISKAQMYRLFKKETGVTPTEYRNKIRIEKACQMIKSNEYNICEIAWRLGFDSPCYFNRVFKLQTGASPTEYLGKIYSYNQKEAVKNF